MFRELFQNKDAIIYSEELDGEPYSEIAAVIRTCTSPDEAVFLTGVVPNDLLRRSDLDQVLLDASDGRGRVHDSRLSPDGRSYLACTGRFEACKLALSATLTNAAAQMGSKFEALKNQHGHIVTLACALVPLLQMIGPAYDAFYGQMRWEPTGCMEAEYAALAGLLWIYENYDLGKRVPRLCEALESVIREGTPHEP